MRRVEAEAVIAWLTVGLLFIGAYEAAIFCFLSVPLLMVFGERDQNSLLIDT
jgi:hypothetical protein